MGIKQGGVRKNAVANVYSQTVNTLTQVVGVPIFLAAWGQEVYGVWLTVHAIPMLLGRGGTSFLSSVSNSVQISVQNEEVEEARAIANASFTLLSAVILFVLLVIALIAVSTDNFMGLFESQLQDLPSLIMAVTFYALSILFSDIFNGLYRSVGSYARFVFINQTTRFLEYLIVLLLIALSEFDPLKASLTLASVRLLGVFYLFFDSTRVIFWFKGFTFISAFDRLRPLVKSTLSFSSLTFGDLLNAQGIVLLISITCGSIQVVQYSLVKTLTNLSRQIVSVINLSTWPEYTRLFTMGDLVKARRYHRISTKLALYISIFFSFVVMTFSESIFDFWTKGTVEISHGFLLLMLVSICIHVCWYTSGFAQISVNRHFDISMTYIAGTVLILMALWFILKFTSDIVYIPALFIPLHTLLLYKSIRSSLRLTDDDPRNYVAFLINPFKF